jgi:type VI secretion system secreted protein VgrG
MTRGRSVVLTVALVVIWTSAAPADEVSMIYACAHKNSGALRVVDGPDACLPSEVEVVWSVVGPQGPEGPQGPPGEVPNADVIALAELVGDPGFADALPADLVRPAGCDATLLATGLGAAPVPVMGLIGSEGISRIPRYRIVVDGDPSPAWLGQPLTVEFVGDQVSTTFGGIATEVTGVATEDGDVMVVVEIAPVAAGLGLNQGFRVAQGTSIPELLRDVLSEAGQPFRFAVTGSYGAEEMIVQYQESDLAFLSRLAENEGIFYFFEPGGTMVVADTNAGFDGDAGTIRFGDGVRGRRLTGIRRGQRAVPASATVIGFDFLGSVLPVVATAPSAGGPPEVAFFDPSVAEVSEAASGAQVELERAVLDGEVAAGSSTAPAVRAGHVVTVEAGPGFDGEYVVSTVRHVFTRDDDGCLAYGNAFAAVPDEVAYRPPRVTPRPRIDSPQTALVVGRPGEVVTADRFGRVKVQFHWDREGSGDEGSSGWVRVAHPAGRTDTAPAFIPEIGDEVLVVFEHGDPSRPIIVGSLYNGDDLPPPE